MNLMKTSEISNCEADNDFHLVDGNSKDNVNALVNSNGTSSSSSSSGSFTLLILLSTDGRMDRTKRNIGTVFKCLLCRVFKQKICGKI